MLITVTLGGALSTLLLAEIELFQLPDTLTMAVTSGNGKSDLHKQNVSVCFFSEQKCKFAINNTFLFVLRVYRNTAILKYLNKFKLFKIKLFFFRLLF
jgi:hypothetical protein